MSADDMTQDRFRAELAAYFRAFHAWGLDIHARYLQGLLDPDMAQEALGKLGFASSILGEHVLGLRDDVARREKEKRNPPPPPPPSPYPYGGGFW